MSLAALCIILAILAAAGYASERAFTRHAERATARNADLEQLINGGKLRRHLTAEAERLFPGTDASRSDDLPGEGGCLSLGPPCSPEDGYICAWHRCQVRRGFERVGKHRAVWELPLDDQPSEVIAAVVTDLEDKKRQQ